MGHGSEVATSKSLVTQTFFSAFNDKMPKCSHALSSKTNKPYTQFFFKSISKREGENKKEMLLQSFLPYKQCNKYQSKACHFAFIVNALTDSACIQPRIKCSNSSG